MCESGQIWIRTSDRLPERDPKQRYSQVPCIVYYRKEVTILVFNHEHMVWDDLSGDDFECQIGDVSHWMPLPAPPEGIEPCGHYFLGSTVSQEDNYCSKCGRQLKAGT